MNPSNDVSTYLLFFLCAEDSFFLNFTEAYLGHDKGAHSHATCNQSCLGCCRGPGMYLGDDWRVRDYNLNHFNESFLKKQHISWKVSSRFFFWLLKKRSLRKFHPKKRWYVRQVNSNAKLSPRSRGKWSNSSNIFRTGWNTQLKKLSPIFLKRKAFTTFFIIFQTGWNHQLVIVHHFLWLVQSSLLMVMINLGEAFFREVV